MEFQHFETNLEKENEYPKLVRDKIPEIVGGKTGKEVKTRIMEDEEYVTFLLKKVIEEAQELAHAKDREHVAEELADIMELIDTILEVNGLSLDEVRKVQKAKAAVRGGFKGKILMLERV
ncbi:MAG: phosphoribosyl-ATP pyrophosphohydrolase [Patescibacteria group bacterium]